MELSKKEKKKEKKPHLFLQGWKGLEASEQREEQQQQGCFHACEDQEETDTQRRAEDHQAVLHLTDIQHLFLQARCCNCANTSPNVGYKGVLP